MATQQTTAHLRGIQMSPRKLRLLVDLVRGMPALAAVTELSMAHKAAARPVLKLIQSAIANATHNHDLMPESLIITKAFVNNGTIMYRFTPRAMGRSAPIRKRTAHVTIVLEGVTGEKKAKKSESEAVEMEAKEESKEEVSEKKVKAKSKTKKATKKSS
jgi:large subunit ribosomal protein L22